MMSLKQCFMICVSVLRTLMRYVLVPISHSTGLCTVLLLLMVNSRDDKLVLVPVYSASWVLGALIKWLRHEPKTEVYKTWSCASKRPHGMS
jgi:hypothetical protein